MDSLSKQFTKQKNVEIDICLERIRIGICLERGSKIYLQTFKHIVVV